MKPVQAWKAQIDLTRIPIEKWKAERMYAQGYRFVGKHSAVKVCEWCKKSIRGKEHCYKQDFYGIESHRCVQMSPAVFFCDFNCRHCWRSLNFILPSSNFEWDSPQEIFDGCLKEQKKVIQGFKGKGHEHDDKKMISEAEEPRHFAISLSGEPTLYPYLPELIEIIRKNKMTSFLVTNGAHPEMVRRLLEKKEFSPDNFYVTLHAPDDESYVKECCPMIKDGWRRLMETLLLMKKFEKSRTVIRLTLNKKINMHSPEKYAKIILRSKPQFVECKAYMAIGNSNLDYKDMPFFEEVKKFAEELAAKCSYKIVEENKISRVVLLKKQLLSLS